MTVPQAFGKALRRLRKKRGWSQEELAFESGHQRVFISWLENGKKQATISTIFSLATALDIEAHELIFEVQSELDNQSQ